MVLAEQPEIIRSYDDLLKKGRIRMVSLHFEDNYKEFEYAPKGNVKRELWEKSLKSVDRSSSKKDI